ncbi:Cytochrome P450 [Actinacidiphila alni]|uniref:Cytochrome P450 n=1 Tax=Actinacidiphila alni TaxID=380248 RepID=A0A1I2LAW5_9ACTN|nr:cytochrome P450 [Actinacidiphila alni]SFF75599.1 Cytochrome P450 [Actinacidiphila alni]
MTGETSPGAGPARGFPWPRAHALDPPEELTHLRQQGGVAAALLPDGTHVHLVLGYHEARQALSDPRLSRESLSRSEPGELVAGTVRRPATNGEEAVTGAGATPYGLVLSMLSPRGAERLRPATRREVGRLLDAMDEAGPPADLIAHLARPLPAVVTGELLGVPAQDRTWVQRLASSTVVFAPTAESRGAVAELRSYFRELLAEPPSTGPAGPEKPGMIGRLAGARRRDGTRVPVDDLVTMLLRIAAAGGHSVQVSLGKGVPLLLRDRSVYAAFTEPGPARDGLVEELLRRTAPAPTALPRLAVEDVHLGGRTLPRGSVVLISLESANLDPARYPDPDQLRPERGDKRHLSFGAGSNYCVGAALARMELTEALTGLSRRFPTLHLAVPEDAVRLREGGIAPDPLEVPVRW